MEVQTTCAAIWRMTLRCLKQRALRFRTYQLCTLFIKIMAVHRAKLTIQIRGLHKETIIK